MEAHRKAQDQVLAELYLLAQVAAPAPGNTDWDLVVAAGMDYADRKCESYMHALFRLNRDRRTVVSEIGLLGAAAAGVMAAAKSAARDVSIVAIAFGLAGATVDNLSSNLLYDLDPSSVRSMVRTLQENYRKNLQPGYRNRPAAMSAIRSYAILCVPSNIEAEVNLSVKKAEPSVDKGDPSKGQPPSVTNAVTVVTSDEAFRNDDSGMLLRNFVFPNGRVDVERRRELEKYLADRGIRVSVVSFIRGASFAQERAKAAAFFRLDR
ncbi:hypothetical protein A8M77_20125 [Variovorax sp. JS1663]|nr:hypothetical protein A8M77_20125 [Variovorax sp. JS1663]